MCGTCGVRINGREGLACGTLVRSLVGDRGGEVRVEPMRHLPVVRDLATDPGVFYQRLNQVGAAFTPKDDSLEPAQILPDSKERKTINPHRECIYCGLCYSACSVAGLDSGYLGPAALNRAFALVSDSVYRRAPGITEYGGATRYSNALRSVPRVSPSLKPSKA